MDDAIFYSRYIDDKIIVFAPKPSIEDISNYCEDIKIYITNELKLSLNTKKPPKLII
jgi:hypothetical protein